MEKEQPATDKMVWVVCGFACGILLQLSEAVTLATSTKVTLAASLALTLAISFILLRSNGLLTRLRTRLRTRLHPHLSPALCLFCLFFALGFIRMDLRDQNLGSNLLLASIDDVVLSARVRSVSGRARGARVILDEVVFAEPAVIPQPANSLPRRISLRYWGGSPPQPEQRIRVTARLLAPSKPLLPSGFDFRNYARFAKIDAYGATKTPYEQEKSTQKNSLKFFLARIRASIGERLDQNMGKQAAIARALLIGDRDAIDRSDLRRIRDAGLAHILAISGLHLGLFAFGTFIYMRRASTLLPNICQRFSIKKIAAATALAAAFCYMLLAGATLPTQRAFIMSGLVLCAVLCDRSALSLRVVALAALLVLAWQPESITQAGFHMSFAAAASLVAFYDVFTRSRHNALLRKLHLQALFLLLTTTIIASLATAPFVIYHFGRIAQYGLLSNLIVIPILGLIVLPFGALSFLLMPFGLEGFALKIMGWGIIWIRLVADWVSELPNAVLLLAKPPPSFLLFFATGLLLIVFCKRKRILLLLGCSLCLCALVMANSSPPPFALFGGEARSLWLRDNNDVYWRFGGWQDGFEYRQWDKYIGGREKISAQAKEVWIDGELGVLRCDNNRRRGDYSCRIAARGGLLEISANRLGKGLRLNFLCEESQGEYKELYKNPRPDRAATTCKSFAYDAVDLRLAHTVVIYPSHTGFRVRSAR